jgi:hypothetical protein
MEFYIYVQPSAEQIIRFYAKRYAICNRLKQIGLIMHCSYNVRTDWTLKPITHRVYLKVRILEFLITY